MNSSIHDLTRLIATVAVVAAMPLAGNAESKVIATGKFEGRGGHKMSGGVTIVQTDSGHIALLEPDFYLDGAPAPRLAFGKGAYIKETQFSKLRENKGIQAYKLPPSIDPSDYSEFWVWCEKFNVPLGVAKLSKESSE